MKTILALAVLSVLLSSCSAIQGISGRVVTKEGEFVVLPDGRIEIVVNTQSGK